MLHFKHFVCALLFLNAPFVNAVAAQAVTDEAAPDFSAFTVADEPIQLSKLRGRYVVLEWTNHECPYVRKHYGSGNMQRLQRKLTEAGAIWISVISSAPGEQGAVTEAEAQSLTTERGAYPSHVVLDPAGYIGRLYKARTTPHIFLIDQKGILRYQGAIDDNSSARRESLKGAKNYLLRAWNELQNGQPVTEGQTKPYGCAVHYGR